MAANTDGRQLVRSALTMSRRCALQCLALTATATDSGAWASGTGTPADVLRVTHWASHWLQLVSKYQQNPLRAARSIAYTLVAMHGAWWKAKQLGNTDAPLCELAAHRAASWVLQHFYPHETPGHLEAQYAWMQSQLEPGAAAHALANTVGAQVANQCIERSLRDGAGRTWPLRNRPAHFPGIWQATYPLFGVNPVEAFAGQWRPWVAPAANRYVPPPAARPGSEQHRAETHEVLAVSRQLSAGQREAAFAWNLESGSVTPPGVWMQHTLAQLRTPPGAAGTAGARVETCLSVLATLSVAVHDAFIACWGVKFRDWSERPITAIRRDVDTSFVPLLVTPSFPAYVSGHAAVSGAAAAVLSAVWPQQAGAFAAMAQEAAMSRLWGGIHFRSDNEEGLRLGAAVGTEVVAARAAG